MKSRHEYRAAEHHSAEMRKDSSSVCERSLVGENRYRLRAEASDDKAEDASQKPVKAYGRVIDVACVQRAM